MPLSLKDFCKNFSGCRFRQEDDSYVIEIPHASVTASLRRLPMGGYLCKLNSEALFGDLVGAYSVDTKNCPPLAFRTDAQFIEDGTFFIWLQRSAVDVRLVEAEKELEEEIESLRKQTETERMSSASQRRGQDALRKVLLRREGSKCMISGVTHEGLLVASHIKGWKESTDDDGRERLDVENVLLLAANWDALFDKKFISFDPETGKMIKAARIDDETLRKFGVPDNWRESVSIPVNTDRRREYLRCHNSLMAEEDAKCSMKHDVEE